jgi:hypothetical protein
MTLHLFLSIPECPMAVAEKTAAGHQPPHQMSRWQRNRMACMEVLSTSRAGAQSKNERDGEFFFCSLDAAPVAEFREFP